MQTGAEKAASDLVAGEDAYKNGLKQARSEGLKEKEAFIDEASKEEKEIEITLQWDMIIELRKPTEQYGYVNITIDMYKEEEWVTAFEKIDEAKSTINYLLNK